MRYWVGALTICLAACGKSDQDETSAPEGVPMLMSFDLVVEKSQDGLKEVKFCGKEGSCDNPEPYPCKVVKRRPAEQQKLFKVTDAMSDPKQLTYTFLATFGGWQRQYRNHCVVELSGLSAVRRYGIPRVH